MGLSASFFDRQPRGTGKRRPGRGDLALDVTDRVSAERSRREFTANVSHELKTPR
jgi:two-component system phosphate regulon sensor histidine kinase PhoR